MTAVAIANTGNPIASLLTVLRVVAKSLTDSYTGILFSLILGKNNWSLANVTLGSWTRLAIWLVIVSLFYWYGLRQAAEEVIKRGCFSLFFMNVVEIFCVFRHVEMELFLSTKLFLFLRIIFCLNNVCDFVSMGTKTELRDKRYWSEGDFNDFEDHFVLI